ncbi:hypothetical protein BE21_49010 [Sorangium cellulosum]|uniref:Uncharacterized protein n=1 Tax=Sorangium cellulosum TaxID=56 RepID=A0A150TH47_SORCE|nr:hypothetical protein BE21_49010 [Sorangium cellulosum]
MKFNEEAAERVRGELKFNEEAAERVRGELKFNPTPPRGGAALADRLLEARARALRVQRR